MIIEIDKERKVYLEGAYYAMTSSKYVDGLDTRLQIFRLLWSRQ